MIVPVTYASMLATGYLIAATCGPADAYLHRMFLKDAITVFVGSSHGSDVRVMQTPDNHWTVIHLHKGRACAIDSGTDGHGVGANT